ncbi:MAG: filamentous hemagglutinin N-terminal domain-containing protein, partial [Acidiferrobacterales bacterium]
MTRRHSIPSLRGRFASRVYPALLAVFTAGIVVAADVTPDGATSTSLDATLSGITIVNIAVPNDDGVSRNTYTDFSVDSQGVILNNADDGGVSQLGGAMLPNPGFAPGVGASVILNEVTSTNTSSLTGYIETFGREASFVLANPNGITCNGCGFINTSRATLITGSEIDPTGAMGSFALSSGTVQIGGLGLNGANIDYVDIVSRVVSIQAGISAGTGVAIMTGNDQYDYTGRVVTSRAGVASPPTYAIDASVLGSMYAGTIQLIATESGVGVRTAGALSAQDRIDIESAGSVETASAEAGNDIRVRAATTFTQNGLYQAGNTIDLEADTFTLLDQIQSDQNLRLVQRQGDWTLGALTGGTGTTYLEAQNGSLILAGRLYAGGDLSLTGQNITNQTSIAARGDLTLNTAGDIYNGDSTLLFAGQNLALNVDGTLTNRGQIYALGTLSATNRSGGQMVALLNQGGRIESIGDMTLKAALFENTHNFASSDAPTSFNQTDRPAVRIDDGVVNGVSNWHEEFNPALKRGLIQTDGNLTIDAGTVNNNLSDMFAAGNISITANALTNTSYFLRQATTESYQVTIVTFHCHFNFFGCWFGDYHTRYETRYRQRVEDTTTPIPGTIQAGSDLNIVATSEINNGTFSAGVSPGSVSGTSDPLAGLTLPGEGGLFSVNPALDASHPYLIETNPDFIDLGALYGSSYFLDRVGYDQAEDTTLFLGDAWYDQRLIAEQVRTYAGQRFLYADAQTNNAQYQMLADQAAVERARLGLQVGVALTDNQIASLDSSIIWYVKTEVQGYNVLAPRLYISTAMRSRLAQGYGAKISGRKVTITAQNILNEGVMVSDTALTVTAAADVKALYGAFVAGSDINLAATDIRLTASTLQAGGHTTLTAANDLVFDANTRTDTLAWTGYGSSYSRTTTTNDISTLTTGGDLRLVAGSDILIAGAKISAAGNAAIDAGGALRVLAVQDSYSSRSEIEKKSGFWVFSETEKIVETIDTTTSRAASISVGGNFISRSGKVTLILASEITSGGDLSMRTDGGDIKLLAGKSTDYNR